MANMSILMAPFETFREHAEREESDEPYGDAFIQRCRQKALKYDKEDIVLRPSLLLDLKRCVPLHFRAQVFAGIALPD
jgi:hypothetical protein